MHSHRHAHIDTNTHTKNFKKHHTNSHSHTCMHTQLLVKLADLAPQQSAGCTLSIVAAAGRWVERRAERLHQRPARRAAPAGRPAGPWWTCSAPRTLCACQPHSSASSRGCCPGNGPPDTLRDQGECSSYDRLFKNVGNLGKKDHLRSS